MLPLMWMVILWLTAIKGSIGSWDPKIRVSHSDKALLVKIMPPLEEAYSYEITVEDTETRNTIETSSVFENKTESALFYQVTGLPTEQTRNYTVMVMAYDFFDESLSGYFGAFVQYPPVQLDNPPASDQDKPYPAPTNRSRYAKEEASHSPSVQTLDYAMYGAIGFFVFSLLVFFSVLCHVCRGRGRDRIDYTGIQ